MEIRPAKNEDVTALIGLWQTTGVTRPWNDPTTDINQARRGEHSQILVGVIDSRLVASVMVGEDGHRGWIYYLATEPSKRNAGIGRMMMEAAENWLNVRGIQKLNLLVRTDNIGVQDFYKKLGYQQSDVVCLQKCIQPIVPV